MSGNNGKRVELLGDRYNVSHKQAREIAEELCHATYLVCHKELAEAQHELVKAFEGRIAGLEAQIAALDAKCNGKTLDSDAPTA